MPFDVDYITFKIVDKKVAKRTAMQEQVLFPGKQLVVEMNEKDGGRHQTFTVENEDLVQAETINELRVR